MEITTDKKNLLDMVKRAISGELALPQFQRNFVWGREDIADLLLSVLKGHFIGSFLILRADENYMPFGARVIASVDRAQQDIRPQGLILDGQQRLTSLHYVFSAPDLPLRNTTYPYRFFLDLNKLFQKEDGELSDDLIFSRRTDQCASFLEETTQYENRILPFTKVLNWSDWQNGYERQLIEKDRDEYFDNYHPSIKPVWDKAISELSSFQVPIIEIPRVRDDDSRNIAEVCAIFEKINSTGVPLSVYDLLTARLFKYKIDLHSLWEAAAEEHPQLAAFSGGEPDVYGLYLLRTLALLRKQEVKAKALINLSPENFQNDWNRAADAVERALERLVAVNVDGFGVFDQRWQPYSTLIPVMAAALSEFERLKVGAYAYSALKCWYWGSVLLERYAGSVDSITYRDAMDLMNLAEKPEFRPVVYEEIDGRILRNENFSILGVARQNSVYKGILNLIAIKGARDFQNNDAIQFHELEDHHVFPKAFLRKRSSDMSGEMINTILNRTLLARITNRKISRKAPSDYLKTVIPDQHREGILSSHFINQDARGAMECDAYEPYLAFREDAILDFLRNYLEPARKVEDQENPL